MTEPERWATGQPTRTARWTAGQPSRTARWRAGQPTRVAPESGDTDIYTPTYTAEYGDH